MCIGKVNQIHQLVCDHKKHKMKKANMDYILAAAE